MQGVLLRRVAQLSSRLSGFLPERFADFVNGATLRNHDVLLRPSTPIDEESRCLPMTARNSCRPTGGAWVENSIEVSIFVFAGVFRF
jgi:hypothetical protein